MKFDMQLNKETTEQPTSNLAILIKKIDSDFIKLLNRKCNN